MDTPLPGLSQPKIRALVRVIRACTRRAAGFFFASSRTCASEVVEPRLVFPSGDRENALRTMIVQAGGELHLVPFHPAEYVGAIETGHERTLEECGVQDVPGESRP